jgi:hypothetical protein
MGDSMTKEKTRKAFETWYCQAYSSEPDDFKKFEDGTYLDPSLQADWDVWQAALAQPVQPVPVLLLQSHRDGFWCVDLTCKKCYSADFQFKHTAPPQRPWVGLTDEEVERYWDWEDFQTGAGRSTIFEMVRDIEAKLKERNS